MIDIVTFCFGKDVVDIWWYVVADTERGECYRHWPSDGNLDESICCVQINREFIGHIGELSLSTG